MPAGLAFALLGLVVIGLGACKARGLLRWCLVGVCLAGTVSLLPRLLAEYVKFTLVRREARVLDDIETFLASERAYAKSNGGLYAAPNCLADPSSCLGGSLTDPGLPARLVPSYRSPDGYHREFHPGAPVRDPKPAGVSSGSVVRFAYTASPLPQMGWRGFCADSSGIVCHLEGGTPPVKDGACELPCQEATLSAWEYHYLRAR